MKSVNRIKDLIEKKKRVTQEQISATLMIDSSTVSYHVNELITSGFAEVDGRFIQLAGKETLVVEVFPMYRCRCPHCNEIIDQRRASQHIFTGGDKITCDWCDAKFTAKGVK